jgi:hypothetical protein
MWCYVVLGGVRWCYVVLGGVMCVRQRSAVYGTWIVWAINTVINQYRSEGC